MSLKPILVSQCLVLLDVYINLYTVVVFLTARKESKRCNNMGGLSRLLDPRSMQKQWNMVDYSATDKENVT